MKRKSGRRLLLDSEIQKTLAFRVAQYGMLFLFMTGLIVYCWSVSTTPHREFRHFIADFWARFGPTMAAGALLLPIVIIDTLRLTSRYAGPVNRVRSTVQRLADGEPVAPIDCRRDDLLGELIDDVNRLIETRGKAPVAPQPASETTSA